ncbi:MAG: hypothetical protein RLY71_510 [Pseudomonadota bacterium]
MVARVWRVLLAVLVLSLGTLVQPVRAAEPGKVIVGVYVNKVQDVSFKDSKFAVDFYIWFRWKPVGELADYKPLESFGLVNGKIDNKTVVDEKMIGEESYASARINATVSKDWELAAFPFDRHKIVVDIEDEKVFAGNMVFEADQTNSRLGDEIAVPGWLVSKFFTRVTSKEYMSNYGDTSLPTGNRVAYSRMSFGMEMDRDNAGTAIKLLSSVVVVTLLAFVVFWVHPQATDPRFGLGVGALFAVSASAFVVAGAVPDSASMTVADEFHMIAVGFIFASILVSALCMRWAEAGQDVLWKRIDRACRVLFPLLFLLSLWALTRTAANGQ